MAELALMNWEAFGSVGAVVIASIALGAAIVEGRATRKHNRLSVWPLLRVDYDDRGIRMHNTGSGPAILREFAVFAYGDPVEAGGGRSAAVVAAERVGIGNLLPQPRAGEGQVSSYTPDIGDSLMAQGQFNLLSLNVLPHEREDCVAISTALKQIAFRVRYVSVYGDEQVYVRAVPQPA